MIEDQKMDEQKIFNNSREVWENNLRMFPETQLNYPDENLVRLFSGRYIAIPKPPAVVMDHGFGHGNNLLFASTKGYDCAGCEISRNLIEETKKIFSYHGVEADLRQISGLEIPFEDESCDIVISWNAIHYNGTLPSVIRIIEEFYRVLKDGGVLLLSTLHPNSCMFDRMQKIDDFSYKITKKSEYDNREGLVFFATPSLQELQQFFSQFSKVLGGEVYYNLFNSDRRHAAYYIYGMK
jgi:SAM-dependent methyltransferase